MSFLLKIVEGKNKGAEVALVEGVAVTMGKSDACDIILADAALPEAPMKIEATAEGVAVDGELLEPFHVRLAGNTAFAVGPAEKAWGKLVWPVEEKEPEKPAEPAVAKAPEPVAPPPEEKRESHGCLMAFIGFLIFIGIIVGLGWYFRDWLAPQLEPYRPQAEAAWSWTQDRAQTAYGWCRNCYRNARERFGQTEIEAEPAVDPAEAIAEIAARYGLEVAYVDDQPVVAGNLKTRAERLSATAEAYAAMPCVELNISDDETLKTAVEDTLSLTGEIGLRVQTVTNRVAVLEGRCADFGAVMMHIAQEVPKLKGVIGDAVKRAPAAQPAMQASGEGEAAEWRPAAAPAPRVETPSLPVCGILTVPYPCLVTRNGARIMEGAAIGEWTVARIGADSVVLEGPKGRFVWRP